MLIGVFYVVGGTETKEGNFYQVEVAGLQNSRVLDLVDSVVDVQPKKMSPKHRIRGCSAVGAGLVAQAGGLDGCLQGESQPEGWQQP